jgi:hypothetical protein
MKYRSVLVFLIVAIAVMAAFILNRRSHALNAIEASTFCPVAKPEPAAVLVELFTSEGCSSCPPADELLASLDRAQPIAGAHIITLSEHVDYWNRLGWADPYSSARFSARQSQYARRFKKDDVYTPQMVVDGRAEFVGSNAARARQEIAEAARRADKATVTLTVAHRAGVTGRGEIAVQVRIENTPAISTDETADVLLAIAESELRSDVSRGENSGRSLSHASVVRRLSQIGSIASNSGGSFTASSQVRIEKEWKRENLKAVVFVQERSSRRVIGVASVKL